jgi:hypothetical protein
VKSLTGTCQGGQLPRAAGFLLEAHGDPRHLIKAGFEVFHERSVDE